jgi:hypothetical protein
LRKRIIEKEPDLIEKSLRRMKATAWGESNGTRLQTCIILYALHTGEPRILRSNSYCPKCELRKEKVNKKLCFVGIHHHHPFFHIFFVDSTTTTTATTMATGISDETIAIVKATAPLVKENVEKITSTFYPKMLGRHPVRKERVIELPKYRYCFISS